jgi:hypothetical protein
MHKAVVNMRILFTGAGIVLLVAVILTVVVIPSVILDKTPNATPVNATIGIAIVIILHLLVLYAFRQAIIVNKRGGHLINVIYIVSGIGLLLLGLIIMDGADAYLGHNQMQLASISMFICVGCDFLAGVIVIVAMFLQPKKVAAK